MQICEAVSKLLFCSGNLLLNITQHNLSLHKFLMKFDTTEDMNLLITIKVMLINEKANAVNAISEQFS